MKNISLMAVLVFVAMAGLAAASCGKDSGKSDAEIKCDDLVSAFCTRVKDCAVEPYDQCMTEAGDVLDCSRAVSVTASYDQCVTEVKAEACSAVTAVPTSCTGVILIK